MYVHARGISFFERAYNQIPSSDQVIALVRRVARAVWDFFRYVGQTIQTFLYGSPQREEMPSIHTAPNRVEFSPSPLSIAVRNEFPPAFTSAEDLERIQEVKEALAFYDQLSSDPVTMAVQLIQHHRTHLSGQALKEFDENTECSMLHLEILHLCIRALVFTSKEISVDPYPRNRASLLVGPSCLKWLAEQGQNRHFHTYGDVKAKIHGMRKEFRRLPPQDQLLFIHCFSTAPSEIPFSQKGEKTARQLLEDVQRMVFYTDREKRNQQGDLADATLFYQAVYRKL